MMMNPKVQKYIDDLIAREGGYVDHPNDRGGPTNHGITEQVARAWGYTGDMKSISKTLAASIYQERYWIATGFWMVSTVSEAIAEEMFDTGVNMGPDHPSRWLQKALNALNAQGKRYPDLTVDGKIGKMTVHTLKTFLMNRYPDGEKVMLRILNGLQTCRYMDIAEKNQSQEDFIFGWVLHRVT